MSAQLLQAAIDHHQRGQLAEAERLYRSVLERDPRQPDALHFLGLAALQQGRSEEAATLIARSLEANKRNAEAHYHLGLACAALGRFKEVETHNRRVIALSPTHAPAHLNLGNALRALGQPREAAAAYRRAIAIAPNMPDAHFNLANVLSEQGDDAIAAYQRAIALRPDYLQARHNLALALLAQRRVDAAIAELDRVLAAQPAFAEALVARALAAQFKGRPSEALACLARAVTLSEDIDARRMFCECATALREVPNIPGLRGLIERALDEPWHRPRDLAPFAALMLRQSDSPAAPVLNRFATVGGASGLSGQELSSLAQDNLLQAILENAMIAQDWLEAALTAARSALAARACATPEATPDIAILRLACTLARQCFINEYVFDLDDDDRASCGALRQTLVSALAANTQPRALTIALAAAHEPLHAIEGADRLLQWTWDAPVEALLTQQIREPAAERTMRADMKVLTPITEGVSSLVRAQYEENPYPRWVKVARAPRATPLARIIRNAFPLSSFRDVGIDNPAMLIAGCGTGQYASEIAQQIAGVRVTALDLSLASLAYAKRKSAELGLSNIDYAQADIVALPGTGLRFDIIESGGVLHHMADPFAGWRGLLSMLNPGGLMRLAFYSERARQFVVAAREMIAKDGYRPDPDGIRAIRRAIRSLPDDAPAHRVAQVGDFYSTSECRDLLFHVQEHRLTLPQIADVVAAENLDFLGFELANKSVAAAYLARFPDDPAMTDLANWDAFERDHPLSFFGMYEFWVQKAP
jgi:tetratricopeptide (TPR) repeat protein/2-polyprenyl-3-methyl-5-hydroxy-6-metoxy-1,4-benzoquinol methylase